MKYLAIDIHGFVYQADTKDELAEVLHADGWTIVDVEAGKFLRLFGNLRDEAVPSITTRKP
jgi:hypothetical protein